MHATEMLTTHPHQAEMDQSALAHCIRLNLDCADACAAAGRMLSRLTDPDWGVLRAQLEAMAQAVRACGDECGRHADEHEHCRVCADVCNRCGEACESLMSEIGASA